MSFRYNLINGSDVISNESLVIVAYNKRLDILRFLIEHGGDVNAKDKYGNI